jgi:hypothetical protein
MTQAIGIGASSSSSAARPAVKSPAGGNRAFMAAVIVLIVAAVGLNGAVSSLQLHFKKLAVPLARPLNAIAPQMGDWMQVSVDEPLDPDIEEVLGTKEYIFRDYISPEAHGGAVAAELVKYLNLAAENDKLDALPAAQEKAQREKLQGPEETAKLNAIRDACLNSAPADRLATLKSELENTTGRERKVALAQIQQNPLFADCIINMAVTYYTGLADTVAHVPDRCYVADGFEPTDSDYPTWTLDGGRQLQVRFINFQDQSGASRIDRSVAYFFHVDGAYKSDPLDVRFSLQDLRHKYGYYAKVECMTLDSDRARSAGTITNFLGSYLPDVEKSFPDWTKLTEASAK